MGLCVCACVCGLYFPTQTQWKKNHSPTIHLCFLLLSTHGLSAGPQFELVNFDKWPADWVESRRRSEEWRRWAVRFSQPDEMLEVLRRKSSDFSKMHAIKQWHQCGKTITHWFLKTSRWICGRFSSGFKRETNSSAGLSAHSGRKRTNTEAFSLTHCLLSAGWNRSAVETVSAETQLHSYSVYMEPVKRPTGHCMQVLVCKDNQGSLLGRGGGGGVWFTMCSLGEDVSWLRSYLFVGARVFFQQQCDSLIQTLAGLI